MQSEAGSARRSSEFGLLLQWRKSVSDPGSLRRVAVVAGVLWLSGGAPRGDAQDVQGEEIYARYCASCHDQVDARIPTRAALSEMSAARILRTLDSVS
jgi:hypothetical protein